MGPSDPAVIRRVANGLSARDGGGTVVMRSCSVRCDQSSAALGSGSVRRYPNDCRESFAPLRFRARCRGFPDTPAAIPDTRSRWSLTPGSSTRADHSVR
jgi:hypothetical protein